MDVDKKIEYLEGKTMELENKIREMEENLSRMSVSLANAPSRFELNSLLGRNDGAVSFLNGLL